MVPTWGHQSPDPPRVLGVWYSALGTGSNKGLLSALAIKGAYEQSQGRKQEALHSKQQRLPGTVLERQVESSKQGPAATS